MQTADDVKLGDGLAVTGSRRLIRLFQGHGVTGWIALLAAECAELAGRHADVGRIDVAIDVEVGYVAMHPLADMVGEPADCEYVVRTVQSQPILGVETLTRLYFGGNRFEPRVIGAKTGNLHVRSGFSLHSSMIQNARKPPESWCGSLSSYGVVRDGRGSRLGESGRKQLDSAKQKG